jgi:uncharacterized protein YbjT (DUF2867 family)
MCSQTVQALPLSVSDFAWFAREASFPSLLPDGSPFDSPWILEVSKDRQPLRSSILSPLIQEAKRRGLQKVVLMTAMGADMNDAAPMRKAEIELENSGLAYNIIRPNWFMQNFNSFWVQSIREQGKILLPAKQAKVSFIDSRDISAVAAKLLTSNDRNNRAFNLTGARAIHHSQVADEISKATGKSVVYQNIEPATLKQGLLAAGVPEDYSDFLVLIFGYLAEG